MPTLFDASSSQCQPWRTSSSRALCHLPTQGLVSVRQQVLRSRRPFEPTRPAIRRNSSATGLPPIVVRLAPGPRIGESVWGVFVLLR
jgi:hypothetical protein